MPITNYLILEAGSGYELRKMVETSIQLGWQPQGGVSVVSYDDDKSLYSQAVVLEGQTTERPRT